MGVSVAAAAAGAAASASAAAFASSAEVTIEVVASTNVVILEISEGLREESVIRKENGSFEGGDGGFDRPTILPLEMSQYFWVTSEGNAVPKYDYEIF